MVTERDLFRVLSGDGDLGGDGTDIGVSVDALIAFAVLCTGDAGGAELAACDARHVGCCFSQKTLIPRTEELI